MSRRIEAVAETLKLAGLYRKAERLRSMDLGRRHRSNFAFRRNGHPPQLIEVADALRHVKANCRLVPEITHVAESQAELVIIGEAQLLAGVLLVVVHGQRSGGSM